MWFIGVEVEQETSAPPPKKILDPPLWTMNSSDTKAVIIEDSQWKILVHSTTSTEVHFLIIS